MVEEENANPKLDLSTLPPIFVSATHFETDDLHALEEELTDTNATLTYDIHEARIVLSKVTKKARIQLDLRSKGVWIEEVKRSPHGDGSTSSQHTVKKQRVPDSTRVQTFKPEAIVVNDDSSTASEDEDLPPGPTIRTAKKPATGPVRTPSPDAPLENEDWLKVVRVDWFQQSKSAGKLLPLEDYITYQGRPIAKPAESSTPKSSSYILKLPAKSSPGNNILDRAKEDAPSPNQQNSRQDRFGKRKFNALSTAKSEGGNSSWSAGSSKAHPSLQLERTTTSDHEGDHTSSSDVLPEPPDWVKQHVKYACQRPTPRTSPNEDFICLLKKIKLARLLTNDEIGVRAYSTSIASLAAYPHRLTSAREILRLPGCEKKIANLFMEWKETGGIRAVEELEADEDMQVLRLFYEIWGCGATTAREFYFDRGWKDLDDIVEFGWNTLTRVQQIGVKYYEEFQDLIPKAEVEYIGAIVHRHAVLVRDDKIQTMIVGGYRRGKEASGDVDIIVSHPDENATLNIVSDIVTSLEDEGWITHTLLLSTNSTHRGQQTLPFRTGGGGHGFDSLDKALVVWQDPEWANKEVDLAADGKAKNPNIHRRVDIIVSPWRTVGCAVTGWSGGTTFQRDLRRYAKNAKGWKFDSSGVRSRINGEVLDVEGWNQYEGLFGKGRARTMEEAEKRVFEGMGLVYREPWDRCTG